MVEKNRLNRLRKKNVQGVLGELAQENKALMSMDADLSIGNEDSLEFEGFDATDGKDITMSTIDPRQTFNTTSTTAHSTFASHLDNTSRLTNDSGGY